MGGTGGGFPGGTGRGSGGIGDGGGSGGFGKGGTGSVGGCSGHGPSRPGASGSADDSTLKAFLITLLMFVTILPSSGVHNLQSAEKFEGETFHPHALSNVRRSP